MSHFPTSSASIFKSPLTPRSAFTETSNTLIHAAKILVVIDPDVDDYQTLAAGTIADATILILDADQDGIAQITEALRQQPDITSLHIVSHGSPGCLFLGKTQLSLETLDRYAWDLQTWFTSASVSSSLLLYGCNVAAEERGSEFLDQLHQLTGAAIAASSTPTGSADLGGDWSLETRIGKVQAPLAFQESVMATYRSTFLLDDCD